MVKIAVFAGTRPEFIKLASVIWRIVESKEDLLFVHTGQHYDYNMSSQFISELDLPRPQLCLDVGSSTQGVQTARVIERAESVLRKENPDFVLAQGDTNSTLGVALASAKLRVPFGHVEAGCRSFDKSMPEEINRVIAADCATLNFAPTKNCVANLIREGIDEASIKLTGHPLVDVLERYAAEIDSLKIPESMSLKRKEYILLTVHREENADARERLASILLAVEEIDTPTVFPIHPRTRKNIEKYKLHLPKNILATDPLGYFHTLSLTKNAKVVMTDSGGIQQEACILETPCITLRKRTEWTETVDAGVNELAGTEGTRIVAAYSRIMHDYEALLKRFKRTGGVFGDGHAACLIVKAVTSFLNQ